MEKQLIKRQQKILVQQKLCMPINKNLLSSITKKTKVINVKVKFLRELGYKDFQQWNQDNNNVYIGRNMTQYIPGATASKWGNPFKVSQYGRDGCIQKYKQYVLDNKQLMNQLPLLIGKNLGCWCKPQPCHGDILVELVENYQQLSAIKI